MGQYIFLHTYTSRDLPAPCTARAGYSAQFSRQLLPHVLKPPFVLRIALSLKTLWQLNFYNVDSQFFAFVHVIEALTSCRKAAKLPRAQLRLLQHNIFIFPIYLSALKAVAYVASCSAPYMLSLLTFCTRCLVKRFCKECNPYKWL